MTTGVLMGGPWDGQCIDVVGAEVVGRVATSAFEVDYAAWLRTYGAAKAFNPDDPTIPAVPRMPEATYRWAYRHGGFVAYFEGIR